MKTMLASAILLLAVLAGGAAAQQSGLASLFDRYDVNPKWAQLPAGQAWGASTSSVAADGKGTVMVLVRAVPYFRAFTREGQPVKAWGDTGLFELAHSVHFGPDGAVWATDPEAHVVHKFSPDGKLLMTLGKKDASGDDASREMFNQPNAVGFSAAGDVFVSDGYGNSRIVQFTAEGRFVRIIGGKKGSGPGELQTPHGVAVDPNGRVLVADSGNKRIAIFDKSGTFVKNLRAPSRGGLSITPDGTVYVSDVNAGAVTIFRDDELLDVIKVDGRPHGLAVDAATGDVYTSSTQPNVWNVTKSSVKKAPASN
jgi:DNA-binding beta-propeller fold protein YncE